MSFTEDDETDECSLYSKEINKKIWIIKGDLKLTIGEMTNYYLLEQYKITLNEDLLKEMIFRLFQRRVNSNS